MGSSDRGAGAPNKDGPGNREKLGAGLSNDGNAPSNESVEGAELASAPSP